MSNVLPKEQQSAYERWELASFNERGGNLKGLARPGNIQQASPAAQLEQLDVVREQARREGYNAGFAEGRAAAMEAGRIEAAREAAAIRSIAENFTAETAQAGETVAQEMLTLALDLAKAMLKTSLAIKPELVLPVVGDAIRYLPSLQAPALLYLNPQDAVIVREHMADELSKAGWRIAEDMQLSRGGCRVETASNQIDASIETRWQRIAEALGQNSDWLDR